MTTRYLVEFGLKATVPAGYDFEAFLERFYDHLLDLEEASNGKIGDPDLTAKLAENSFAILMAISSDDPLDVQMCALTSIRTALHAAGAATPGWEVLIEQVTSSTRAAELMDA